MFFGSLETLLLKYEYTDHVLVFPGILEHLVILLFPDIPEEKETRNNYFIIFTKGSPPFRFSFWFPMQHEKSQFLDQGSNLCSL